MSRHKGKQRTILFLLTLVLFACGTTTYKLIGSGIYQSSESGFNIKQEQIKAMKEGLAKLREQGLDKIEN